MSSGGRVVEVRDRNAKIELTIPVCTSPDEKLALSRRIDKHWRYDSSVSCLLQTENV